MTQEDAINRMLRYIGELPIPTGVSIDDLPEGHEAVIARDVLNETSAQEQEVHYWFNYFEQSYKPSASGYISLPPNVVSIQADSKDVRIEGNDLYDVELETKFFTEPLQVKVLLVIEFEDLPLVFQTFVILKAAKELHVYFNGDEVTQNHLTELINQQYLKLDREDIKQKKPNLIRGRRLIDRTTNPSSLA